MKHIHTFTKVVVVAFVVSDTAIKYIILKNSNYNQTARLTNV